MTKLGFIAGALVLVACSETVPDVKPISPLPASSSTNDTTNDDGTKPDAGTPTTPGDAGNTSTGPTTYIGTLDSTAPSQFGGVSPHCTYDVTLKNVSIEVDVNSSGQVIGATAGDLMVETIVGSCPYAPQPNSQQTFAFSTANGDTLSFVGGADNHPQTDLKIKLTKTGASYQAAATWTRTDLTDDFQWVVNTQITLGPR